MNKGDLRKRVGRSSHYGAKTQEGAGIREGSYWANYDTEKLVGFVVEILQPAPGSDGRTPGVVKQETKES